MKVDGMDEIFSEDEINRYSRHILLDEVGGDGQAKLRSARVLVVGAGGLGSPLALYLAAAGVGVLGLADHDRVELSNLQRQVAHTTAGIGSGKAASAARAAQAINPLVRLAVHEIRVDAGNVAGLIDRYDIVCDGTDNFAARFLLADACWKAGKTLVSAAVLRFEGQLSTFRQGPGLPCYRCLYPEAPPPELEVSCGEAGVLGTVTGVMGTLQANEVLKEIMGIGDRMAGRLMIWDALAASFRTIRVRPDPSCAFCAATREQAGDHQHEDKVVRV